MIYFTADEETACKHVRCVFNAVTWTNVTSYSFYEKEISWDTVELTPFYGVFVDYPDSMMGEERWP